MSYQVLARKWRPRTFAELVGQEHVQKALMNALNAGRLHHAFIFTGTRGVGKTTIARIISKCLNCETGITATPCGDCSACQQIDQGRFVDLLEIDAASRTRVDETRELLDNVQYAPSRGRYKVYLIDEVHMLSTSSFNALLKTLEEPPEHVKFLLATTDPQKLPVTVLSRCLQFNLKRLSAEKIAAHLAYVLGQESLEFEESALALLARAADGSMRDALSLLDQGIAFGNGKVGHADMAAMLGSIDQNHIQALLQALVDQTAETLLAAIAALDEQAPDYDNALVELASALQRMAIGQNLPKAVDDHDGQKAALLALAQQLSPSHVQLYYQTAINGRKDLALAPSARQGFEMTLLRMLAFAPLADNLQAQPVPSATSSSQTMALATPPETNGSSTVQPAAVAAPQAQTTQGPPQPVAAGPSAQLAALRQSLDGGKKKPEIRQRPTTPPASQTPPSDSPQTFEPPPASSSAPPAMDDGAEQNQPPSQPSHQTTNKPVVPAAPPVCQDWLQVLNASDLGGIARELAMNCHLQRSDDNTAVLQLDPKCANMRNAKSEHKLLGTLEQQLKLKLKLEVEKPSRQTPHQNNKRLAAERQQAAEQAIVDDPVVQAFGQLLGGKVRPGSTKPINATTNPTEVTS